MRILQTTRGGARPFPGGVLGPRPRHGREPQLVRAAVSIPILLVSLAAITVMFLFIDRGATTTRFMVDLGAQPTTAIYSIIAFTYCGAIITAMLALAARQLRNGRGIECLPAGLLTLGSAFGVALCLAVLTMDIAHTTGQLDVMRTLQPAYGPLSLLAFLFLCAGFTAQPVVRRAQYDARRRRTAVLAAQLEPLWERATRVRPGLSQAEPLVANDDNPEGRLHRRIVEIRDAMIDPRITFTITDVEHALLEQAEQHLIGQGQTDATPAIRPRDAGGATSPTIPHEEPHS